MTEPLKISQAGRPLTCDEHDDNLDRLRDRANHTGTQSCTTISDLDVCLATSSTITTINSELGTQDTRIGSLETALQSGGSIQTDLQNLQNDLENQINTVQLGVNQNTTNINNNDVDIAANAAEIDAVSNALSIDIGALGTRLTTAESDINTAETDIDNLQNSVSVLQTNLNTETSQRTIADNNLQSQITTEVTNRTVGDNNLSTALATETSLRTTADTTIQGNLNVVEATLQGNIDTEEAQRIAEDNVLQAQIDTLSSSLGDAIPTGVIMMWVGAGVPAGFKLCNATELSRTTFSALFNIIGTTYGTTNSTNFLTPNFNGRFPVGMSSQTSAAQATVTGGDSIVQITTSQLPTHTHSINIPNHQHTTDTTHFHGLFIHPHTHTGGGGGTHQHQMSPPKGSGDGVWVGKNSSTAPRKMIYDNSSDFFFDNDVDDVTSFNQPASAGGAAIGSSDVQIYPPPFTGINRTDDSGGNTISSGSGAFIGATGSVGTSSNFDNRPAFREVKFIIKT